MFQYSFIWINMVMNLINIVIIGKHKFNMVILSQEREKMQNSQSGQNEFLRNSYKKELKIPKQITIQNQQTFQQEIQKIKNQKSIKTPSQILQQSRTKIINDRITKSNKKIQLFDSAIKSFTHERVKMKQMIELKIRTDRFSQYQDKLITKISCLEKICQQNFGGMSTVNKQLSKNALSKQQAEQYFKQIAGHYQKPYENKKIDQLKNKDKQPKLPKLRSMSEKSLSQKNRQKVISNKWYIEPKKRFSGDKEATKYDWKTQEGIKNVIRTKEFRIKGKQVNDLIDQVKKRYNRQPLFCKYAKIN